MLILKISGGLGNQMFQYAYIRSLGEIHKSLFQIDSSFLERMGKGYIKKTYGNDEVINFELNIFNINIIFCNKDKIPYYENIKSKKIYDLACYIKKYIKSKNHYIEKQFNFDNDFLNISAGYIEGYFQTEKYFKNYENIIRKDFEFKEPPKNIKNIEIIEKIKNSNSVAVHFRRGDYELSKNSFIGIQNNDYYKKAVNLIENKIDNPVFFFFSDDINWVKNNFKVNHECHYIDWNTGNDCHEDMRLMSLCKHNIIANSSFSWWGAWLNKNINKIVIAPEKWFQTDKINYSDVIPENWIKI